MKRTLINVINEYFITYPVYRHCISFIHTLLHFVANDMQKFPHLYFFAHKNQQAAINAEKCEQHVQIAAQKNIILLFFSFFEALINKNGMGMSNLS